MSTISKELAVQCVTIDSNEAAPPTSCARCSDGSPPSAAGSTPTGPPPPAIHTPSDVATRTVATHALPTFGDHSDVMAARSTGWVMLALATPQEAHDLAAIAPAATLASRVRFVYFFDDFRTSHELNAVALLDEAVFCALVAEDAVVAHRRRSLSSHRPALRGSA